ncbi:MULTISPECIES: class I SAM-dependent methyltransferase [unclassified Ruegeria]|uniref:class I SAM-dependent methyltransferase n=1 Tax=unclassified Ruegeria TaxID=2625375 RepID=UPI001489CA4E|nr:MULTISPECIES: class I SAM-dependent methyltransferase [unclassified Ruegeria]
MTTNSASFVGDIPTHYDKGLGPNIFVDYAALIAEKCCDEPASSVIELAAGTGIVSRFLRDKLPAEASLLVTDLNAPMLEVAKAKFSGDENIQFAVANAMELPFDGPEFDLMVCQFGVMFFPDKIASYREAARVLRPGGRYVFNVWSPMSENPFSQMAHELMQKVFPDDPPGFYKVPFHYGDPATVLGDLSSAGWSNVTHETIKIQKKIQDLEVFSRSLVFGNPLIDEINERGGVDPEDVVKEFRAELENRFGPDGMTMPLSATMFVCRLD